MAAERVAVIDIGSNSIKVLVASAAADGGVFTLYQRALDARISTGIAQMPPRLTDEGIARGVEAIRPLLADAQAFAPAATILVATSAVRDAANGADFSARVRQATGHPLRILTGEEEATYIGRGLVCDPALRGLQDFYVFDLGGGSLECLSFCARRIRQAQSLPLGCVRLTERFVADPATPFPTGAATRLAAFVRSEFAGASFRFDLPADATAVATGGTVTTVRAILGAHDGRDLEATSPLVSVEQLRAQLLWIGALSLPRRREVRGLPPPRADVFPAALATLVTLAEIGRFAAFHHSLFNLRYGLAADLLGLP